MMIGHNCGFSQLDFKLAGVYARRLYRLGYMPNQILIHELTRPEIDRDTQCRIPFRSLFAGFAQDPKANRVD